MNTRKNLNELIKESLQTQEIPSDDLNQALKIQIRERAIKRISLWYIPMIANAVVFICINVVAQILIPSTLSSKVIFFISLYFIYSGISLTFAAIKYLNFKEIFAIEIEKGGI